MWPVFVDNSATASGAGGLRGFVDVDYLLKSGYGLVQQDCNRTAALGRSGRRSAVRILLHVPHHSATKGVYSLQNSDYRSGIFGIRC